MPKRSVDLAIESKEEVLERLLTWDAGSVIEAGFQVLLYSRVLSSKTLLPVWKDPQWWAVPG
jgi:hypothetical protein